MNTDKLYTTAGEVQAYVLDYHKKYQAPVSFPAALNALKEAGKLLKQPPPLPPFFEINSAQDLNRMLLSFPLEALSIIRDHQRDRKSSLIREVAMFPFEKDVFCLKHFPYMIEDLHAHDYFEITYMYEGSCRLLIDDEAVTLNQGDVCIVPPLAKHNQPIDPDTLAICIAVRSSTFDSIFGSLLTQKDLVSAFFRHSLYGERQSNFLRLQTNLEPGVKNLLHQLIYETNRNDAYANSVCVSLFDLFLAQMMRLHSDTANVYRADRLKSGRPDFLLILQYIQQNYRHVTLDTLSKVFHYSPTYLCRLIRHNLNQSFVSTVRSLKLGRAREYLQNNMLQVNEVAALVGYNSVDHFSREFKRAYGQSPAKWRSGLTG